MTNTIIQKLLKIKGIGYIALALVAGIALLLVNSGSKEQAPPQQDKNAAFVAEAEQALCALGRKVCGVSCKAAVSISSGYCYTYASDQSVRTVYNADGTVAEKETTLTSRTVNVSGGTALVPVKETPPKVSGVVMVCRGADASAVNTLCSMISALYGLDSTAIFVTN